MLARSPKLRWKIDDVLGVWPLHGLCGTWERLGGGPLRQQGPRGSGWRGLHRPASGLPSWGVGWALLRGAPWSMVRSRQHWGCACRRRRVRRCRPVHPQDQRHTRPRGELVGTARTAPCNGATWPRRQAASLARSGSTDPSPGCRHCKRLPDMEVSCPKDNTPCTRPRTPCLRQSTRTHLLGSLDGRCCGPAGRRGCTGLPKEVDRPVSHALRRPWSTPLGRLVNERRTAAGARSSQDSCCSAARRPASSRLALVEQPKGHSTCSTTPSTQTPAPSACCSAWWLLHGGVQVRVCWTISTARSATHRSCAWRSCPTSRCACSNPCRASAAQACSRMFRMLGDFQRPQQRMQQALHCRQCHGCHGRAQPGRRVFRQRRHRQFRGPGRAGGGPGGAGTLTQL